MQKKKNGLSLFTSTRKKAKVMPRGKQSAKFHGISPFDKATGETKKGSETYSARFGNTLVRLAKNNKKIVAITGAILTAQDLTNFKRSI